MVLLTVLKLRAMGTVAGITSVGGLAAVKIKLSRANS
jgi:hypothetical protein